MFTVFVCCLLTSMKGLEQVECKFYNELGRILVKDFPSVSQLDEPPGDPEDSDFTSFSHQDMGTLTPNHRLNIKWKYVEQTKDIVLMK